MAVGIAAGNVEIGNIYFLRFLLKRKYDQQTKS